MFLLSYQHSQLYIGPKGNLEIIEFYNATAGGVDAFDQMSWTDCYSRKTRRWPLRTPHGMLYTANVNFYIIYKENMERSRSTRTISR